MIVKVSDIADVQGGIVLSRKEAKDPSSAVKTYKRLTLRSLTDDGFIDRSELEEFFAIDHLSNALFTSNNDIAVRLAFPLFPVTIRDEDIGLLVPSQIAILKVKDSNIVLPDFLRLCLAQKDILERVQKLESGTAQRTIKIGTILDLQIVVPDIDTQMKAVSVDKLSRQRERMYRSLIAQERLLTDSIIENIIGGRFK